MGSRRERNHSHGHAGLTKLLMVGEIRWAEDTLLWDAPIDGIGDSHFCISVHTLIRTELHYSLAGHAAIVNSYPQAREGLETIGCGDGHVVARALLLIPGDGLDWSLFQC